MLSVFVDLCLDFGLVPRLTCICEFWVGLERQMSASLGLSRRDGMKRLLPSQWTCVCVGNSFVIILFWSLFLAIVVYGI
jgi:hypothetical protein